ncbi:MAG: T9SS type A sorting domain-containing protein [Fibrobacter sp.]|nr:T9SS type A sorting domain-containing protein [Fibrobacter sp.]
MVYYVGDKVSSVTYDIADGETALPANLYQVGSKLVGWSFDQNAETGMVNFDNDFIAAYNAATTEEDGAPTKLYAVWSEVKVPTVVIKNADTEKGTLNVIPYGYTEWMPVPADGLEIPMVDGGLSFEVKFAAAEGYAMAADLVAYDQMGKEMAGYIVDGVMTVAENVVIKGVDAVNDYSIKFVVATTDNDIYFASDWESAGEFNVTDKSTLPNNVARSGYVLAGWALTPDAESGIMTLTGDFAKDLSAEEENSLYPVWEANEASVYVIASNNLEAGTLTLSQTVEGNTYDHEVPAEGLKVPAIKNLVLDVSFATSVGYSLNATSAFYTVDAEGNALAALKSGTLTVDGDAIIQAPVFAETYEFAFRVNSGDQRVFYGRTWFEDKSYDLTMEEADRKFSGDIYRTDSCFVGWTFEENGTEYFNEFNAAFLNAAVEYNVAPGVLKDLYAVWSEDCGEQKNVTVKLANADAGIITLTQSVSKTSWNVDLDETGLEIPAVKGIDFTVAIEINAGYTADGDWAYYMIVDEKQELVGDKFVVEPSLPEVMLLNVPAVEDPSVEFAFDANAGSANVFYGADWRASGSFYLGCDIPEFPKDVYRTDSVWKGWAFTANGSETFTKFDISFIKAMRAAKDLGLNTKTLYAIWTAPEVEIETVDVSVSFKNASSGKITLSQMVDEYNEVKTEYDLTSGQKLAVPVVEGGLVFNANATTTDGFDLEGDYPIVLMDAQGVELDSIANDGTVTISAATNVAVKVYAPDEYIFLDVNVAADVNLFFDSDWVDYVIADVDSNNALPMNLYRGDAVLAGWALTADASVSDAVQEFSADMLKKMVEQNEYKLYAVWKSGNDNIYVVTNTDADKGSMTLTRMVGDDSYEYEVPSAGLKIPAEVANDLYVPAFTLTAIGYEWNDGAYKAVVGTEETAIPEAGFKIESDVAIAAPISQLGFEIVFDSYIPDDRVFFGKNWTNRAIDMTFDVGFASKFPMDIYRVGYCLEGWTINPNATEDEPVFTEFSEDFVKAALETYADDYAGKVYTKWAACENETYRISADAGTVGYIELTQYGELDSEGNPIWIDFYRLTGDDDALIVPKGNGDISFTIEYTTSDGYSKDDPYLTYVYNASGRLLTSLSETESYVFTSDAKLKAGVSADHFTIVFDVNAADGAPVFYNDLWRASGEFDLDMDYADLEFPMAFRAGLRLAGWALEKAPAANADYYDVFTPELAKTLASGKAENVTLYAVWENDQYQESARITVADMEKGSVTLENAGNKFEIDEYGLLVPAVENGIAFKASYSVALGYSAPVGASLTYELDGESMTVNNGILLVESADDITLEIPAEADEAMRFAFDVNANGANVFYADGWKFEGSFNMGGTNSVFPEGIYRTDAKFLGWALSAESRRYFNEFDSEFIEAVKSMKDLGMKAEVLYAVWDTYALVETVRLTSGSEESGYFTVFQTVGGENFYYEVGAEGLEVPATETGLTFKASFETRPGYTIASQMPIIVESSETSQIENGGEFKAVANTVLDADANADQYRFAFNVNAGDANVFYGDSWSSTGEYSMATHEEFPRVIYQSNRVLVGWSLDSAGEELYNGMNEDLVTKLSDKVTTLYAVWEDSEVETYKVSFANTEVGDLKLVQIVENDTIAYEVGDDGLDVPVIDGGFRFKVAFMAGADYTNLVDADELFSVDENGEETAIEDEQIVVEKDLTIGIPVALEVFTVVFDENTDRKNVFYGSDWVAGGKYSVNEEGKGKPLPQYIYTADACVAGWTFGSDTTVYSDFNVELANAFKAGKRGANGYELKAKWVDAATCVSGAYIPAYASVSLVSEHGTVEFVEKSSEGNELVHTFDKKGNMLLPLDFDGQKLILRSIADSSFVMDSLVLVRENGDAVESYTYVDGKRMDFNMQGKFTAYYSKSNKTDVEIVDLKLEQSGSMIRVSIVTSEFEVTRNVEARVVVMDALGNVVVEKVVADSIKQTPANLVWTSSEPLPIGEYVVFADLSEGDDVVSESRSFSVDGAIVALGKDKWQMISMAIVDTSAIIWDDDPKFFWWDEVGEPGEFWQYKEFTKHDEVVAERGYWYSSLEGRDLPLNMDVKPVTKDVTWDLDSLVSGWNLVANPYGWSVDLYNANKDKYAQFDEDAEVQFLRYDEEIENYAPVYVLKPYEAVWAAVKSHTTWTLKAEAEFASDVAKDFPEMDKEDISKDSTSVSVSKRKALAKANSKNKWSMQAVLSDNNGRKDFWNILGVSDRPFVSAEPPAPMGDHVSLSVLEGKKAFAKSFKKVADSYEWQISMAASSDRFGYLSLEGVAGVKSLGYHVYVTIDGKTTEVLDGDQIRVALKAKATTATINVTEGRLNTVVASINGLRMTQGAGKVNVGFNVDDGLAGSRTVVDIVNLDGKVMATYSTKAEAGYNLLHLDAPKSGLYMLRVRVASQQVAGKIMVR